MHNAVILKAVQTIVLYTFCITRLDVIIPFVNLLKYISSNIYPLHNLNLRKLFD